MQGQGQGQLVGSFTEADEFWELSTVGSFTEATETYYESNSNNTDGGQRLCLNLLNPSENRRTAGHASGLEERGYGPSTNLSLVNTNLSLSRDQAAHEPSYPQDMRSHRVPRNFNLNTVYADNDSGTDNVLELDNFPHQNKIGGSETNQTPSFGVPGNPYGGAFGSGHLTGDGDSRQGSFEGMCLPCKRKSTELSAQMSVDGSTTGPQPAEAMLWRAPPVHHCVADSSQIASQLEDSVAVDSHCHLNPEYGVGRRAISSISHSAICLAGVPENPPRNTRTRFNPGPQDSTETSHVHPPVRSFSEQLTADQSLNVQQTTDHLLRDGAFSSRVGSLSPTIFGVQTSAVQGVYSITRHGALPELPVHTPEVPRTTLVQHPTNLISSHANISNPRNPVSNCGPHLSVTQPSVPTLAPHQNAPNQYPERLAEVRRTLLAAESDSEEESVAVPPFSHYDPFLSPETGHQRLHQPYSGSASMTQEDEEAGIPLLVQAERRARLLSEILNVIQILRHGGHLNFEDFTLPHSFLTALLSMYERHPNLLLDVEDMSHEQLLVLGEQMGNVRTGLTEETISTYLKQGKYTLAREGASGVESCCICQEAFLVGEELGMLDCRHDYHTHCIKRWLMEKNVCPICKSTALVEATDT